MKVILKNGLTVIAKDRPTKSVAIEVSVKVGSNYEPKGKRGISHFLEHTLFEGTKTRTTRQIANEIESLGGELNAITTSERTFFYIIILKKFFNKALEILADILQNPKFDKKSFEKEKKIVLDEINLINDDPKLYQFVLFEKTLFKKHPVRNPVYGVTSDLKKVVLSDLVNYYKKYYLPNNIIISVSGLGPSVVKKIEKAFPLNPHPLKPKEFPKEKPTSSKKIEIKDIAHSYIVLGYKTVNRKHEDSYVFDVIQSILSRGQSSRLFEEIRTKRGLAYNVGAANEADISYGYFAAYASADISKIPLIKNIMLEQFRLNNLTAKELEDAKNFIEGHLSLKLENNAEMADWLASWEMVDSVKSAEAYLKKIKKVSSADIKRVIKKYFRKPSYIILKQKL